jgi:hypothetical protein
MKLKNHPFFKTYRNLKYFLLLHLTLSLVIFITLVVHGVFDGDISGRIVQPFGTFKGLYNPEKY